jgi:hypothetical protein
MPTDAPPVRIYLRGAALDVPDGEPLLRALERVAGRRIAEGNYCWTGECGHCEVVYATGAGPARSAMACRLAVAPGMRVTAVSRYLETDVCR